METRIQSVIRLTAISMTSTENLQEKGHTLKMYCLREMDIHQCIGCFNCFTKTPGICVHKDDMIAVCKTTVRSDLMVFASPLYMGFVSSTDQKGD